MLARMFNADWHMKNRHDDKVLPHWACTLTYRRYHSLLHLCAHVLPCNSQVSLPGSATVRPTSHKVCATLTSAILCRGGFSSTGTRSTLG